MRSFWRIVRAVVLGVLLTVVLVPSALYVLLSVEAVQGKVRDITSTELSHLLGARVSVGNLSIRPFSRVSLSDLTVVDSAGNDTVASVRRVSAGLEFWRLVRDGEIVVDYAYVDGVDLRLWRRDSLSDLNIAPILAHLRSDSPRERSTPFELRINTVIVRNAFASYDVLAAPLCADGRFDPNHVRVGDLAVNAYIPRISTGEFRVDLGHLSARERCGFELRRLSARLSLCGDTLSVENLAVRLSRSSLSFEPLRLDLHSGDLRLGLRRHALEVRTASGCRLYPDDFEPFVPAAGAVASGFDLVADVYFNGDSVNVRQFEVDGAGVGGHPLCLRARGWAAGLDSAGSFRYGVEELSARLDGVHLLAALGGIIPEPRHEYLRTLPLTEVAAGGSGTLRDGSVRFACSGDAGSVHGSGTYRRSRYATWLRGNMSFDRFCAGFVAGTADVGRCTGNVSCDIKAGRHVTGNVRVDFSGVEYKSYPYRNLAAQLDMPRERRCEATVSLEDPNATALVYAFYDGSGEVPSLNATASLANIDLTALGLPDPKPGYRCGAKLIAVLNGNDLDDVSGSIDVTDLRWLDSRNRGLRVPRLTVTADSGTPLPAVTVESGILNGSIRGDYSLTALPGQLLQMIYGYLPALFRDAPHVDAGAGTNRFTYDFTVNSTQEISEFFGLPAALVYPAEISGRMDREAGFADLRVDAPYVLKGDKLYANNIVYAALDSTAGLSRVYVTTQFPTKKGQMILSGTLSAAGNRVDTRMDWTIDRRIPISGTVDFSTELRGLAPAGQQWLVPVEATVNFNPGTINFGYETWSILPSAISTGAGGIAVGNFVLDGGDQRVAVDGVVSHAPSDTLTVDLRGVELLPIFETLEIDKAMLSGRASGTFRGASLLGGDRFLECPALHVDSIGYNRCTIGDADIIARWDGDKESFFLDADIIGDTGRRSRIVGDILPAAEALDLSFYADSVPVGFLKPFMDAFARDISGRASGYCRLFGTFKEIDLEGDVYGDNISMAVDFTNTVYTTSDSVHMRPGRIIVPAATMYDREGHTATIRGWVSHSFFKRPSYRFDVSDARDFLAYNVTPAQSPDWYGTIYGNGTASVYGHPGVVNIDADMSTGPRSTFTFVLTDRLDAADYSFINFRDVTPDSLKLAERVVDDTPLIVRELQQRLQQQSDDEPSEYNMKLSVDITPEAALILVMDPAADDKIKATGSGNVTMYYNSTDEDLRLYGSYSVASGSYRFTLQDIIIKDFTIREGSTISFDGDPYAVRSDLQAYYATTANLSDLDESFLQDREVARTKVPVHALMNVRGDIRQPEISFDLEFPTLTDDTYRKVRSIVSTSDMMNRQIIYLLALNRFYTPDYMNSTTRGSELFSVASSTISSQLGSLLGKLSDNWSIAPNLRSDRGDFSDIEVDVALSSRLLDNRLLFNGNFGYRDKSLNSNQFVGDFDIEYLLNPRGTWRLKAYNRYNDANYYLRSAATTQGIGIMYRHDFDSLFPFLRFGRRRKPCQPESSASGSAASAEDPVAVAPAEE